MIFHIFGGKMSGKTSAAKQLNTEEFLHWDIVEDFYKPEGIIDKENKMNWTLWRDKEELIATKLNELIENNKDKHIVIESTGINTMINKTLKTYGITPVNMGVPNAEDTVNRCTECGFDIEVGYDLNKKIVVRFWDLDNYLPKVRTIDGAVKFIVQTSRGESKE